MASSSGPSLNEELQCSICLKVFTDPVTTPCGHNFCRTCLSKSWTNTQTCFCPLCKETFSKRPDLKINTTFRDVAQHFKKLNPGESEVFCDFCGERNEKAVKTCLMCQSSYCETHLEPHLRVPRLKKHKLINAVENLEDYICQKHERPLELFCRDDQTCVCLSCTEGEHRTHNTVPIEEESREKKMIQDRMKKIEEITRSEQRKTRRASMDCSTTFSRTVHFSNWMIIGLGVLLVAVLIILHKQYTMSKGLEFVQKFAVDVTLDPDTAYPYLILSEDGKQVSDGHVWQNVPENPKRFDTFLCVLAKQGFSSGRFYYEVQVKGKSQWALGVARESINRKKVITLSPEDGFWTVVLKNENHYKAYDSPSVSLSQRVKPEKVGVFVDYEEGLVSFYDVESRSHIYSFTGQTFTDKLYPYFSPGLHDEGENSNPLIITPVR